MSEVWKKFGSIEVSNYGRFKTLKHKDGTWGGTDNGKGYKVISVEIDKKQTRFQVHRLVAHIFIGLDLADTKTQVNHINCVRDDNRVDNLELVNPAENRQKSKRHINGNLWGVHKKKSLKLKPWQAVVRLNNKAKYLGYYKTERLAHMVAVANYIDAYGVKPQCSCDYCN